MPARLRMASSSAYLTYHAFVELDRLIVDRLSKMFQENVQVPIQYQYSSSAGSAHLVNGNE
jgi:hypothetical protein